MKTLKTIFLATILLMITSAMSAEAQQKVWSLNDCVTYALEKNIDVQKAGLSQDRNQLNAIQAENNRLPSVSGSVRQNFNWSRSYNSATGDYEKLSGSNGTSMGLNSSLSLFNGNKLNNRIKQARLDLESSKYYTETVRESVALNILDAFLQVLYAAENVKNNQKQIEATIQELSLAQERLNLSVISTSDYLQIKSQLASEKLTLANSQNQLTLAKVSLMQLMELPVTADFEIAAPDLNALLNKEEIPNAQDVYNTALGIKPQIKNAEINSEAAQLDVSIARADLLPVVSVDAGLNTGFSSGLSGSGFMNQITNKIAPSAGLTLSIPVFQKKQVKTNISLAEIAVSDARLTETNTKNQLRKAIEQACTEVSSARTEYQASLEKYQAQLESNQVANEKFDLGLMNSVDFLFEKTNLITAESQLLQSKYYLIFSYKVVDFYKGKQISVI